MNVVLNGLIMESNGPFGSRTNNCGGVGTDSSQWTDHWYLPGPIVEDVGPVVRPADYVVQPGDTMANIAAYLGVSLDALESVNPGVTNFIVPGEVIKVP
jgi:hypothetical protein